MCGAFQLFTTTASSLESNEPTEPTEPNRTQDEYDDTGQRGDENGDKDMNDTTDQEGDTDSGKNDISDTQSGNDITDERISASTASRCLQFMMFDMDRDLFISPEELEMTRNLTFEENNSGKLDSEEQVDISQKEEQLQVESQAGKDSSGADESKENQEVTVDGSSDDQASKGESNKGLAADQEQDNSVQGDQGGKGDYEAGQAEKTSGELGNGAADDNGGEGEANGGTDAVNSNDNNNNAESEKTDKPMEIMNSDMILALDIDNDSLVSLAEFLGHELNPITK